MGSDLALTEVARNPPTTSLPSVFAAWPVARKRMRDFFSAHIRNANTRRAYMEAVRQFSAFCAAWHRKSRPGRAGPRRGLCRRPAPAVSKPTVKQRLAALRMLFDWMVPFRLFQPLGLFHESLNKGGGGIRTSPGRLVDVPSDDEEYIRSAQGRLFVVELLERRVLVVPLSRCIQFPESRLFVFNP
jgi:hypothetical protein